jgi:hypothetical protein
VLQAASYNPRRSESSGYACQVNDARIECFKTTGPAAARLKWAGPSFAGSNGVAIAKEWLYNNPDSPPPVILTQNIATAKDTPKLIVPGTGEPASEPLAYAILTVISLLLGSGVMAQQAVHPPESAQGSFFAKKEYAPCPLPRFDDLRGRLPSPIFDEKPEWVRMYWKAWELGFRNFNEPKPGSGMKNRDSYHNTRITLNDTNHEDYNNKIGVAGCGALFRHDDRPGRAGQDRRSHRDPAQAHPRQTGGAYL